MTTKTYTVTPNEYTRITFQQDFALLNRDAADVRIYLGDSQPAVDTNDYFLLSKENGVLSTHIGDSTVWARSATSETCDVTVAE